ncbi:MAG: hypothetical protein ACYCO3_06790 [Mycobacteriales bacterium]
MPTTLAPTLSAAPAAGMGRRCFACGTHRVTELAMTLTDGSPVRFVSCHACEHKTWWQDGAELGFDSVLAKARKTR